MCNMLHRFTMCTTIFWILSLYLLLAFISFPCICTEKANPAVNYVRSHFRRWREIIPQNNFELKSSCTTKEGLAGICLNIQNCSFAIENWYRSQMTVCTWQGFVPVVCCTKRPDNLDNLLPLGSPTKQSIGSYSASVDSQSSSAKSNKSTIHSGRPWKPTITEILPFPNWSASQIRPVVTSPVEDGQTPIPFAGENGRPKPSEAYSIHSENGSLLFTLRNPIKYPFAVAKEMLCGVPSYNVQGKPKGNERTRPNSKDPDTLYETSSIVGGTAAAIGSFPWMAAIFKGTRVGNSFRNGFLCAGSIVDARNIISAAHCFEKSDHPSIFSIRVGSHDLSAPTSSLRNLSDLSIEKIIFHPEYKPPQIYNDLVILRLSKPLSLGSGHVMPICLPDAQMLANLTMTEGTIAGWGSTSSGRPGTTVLQQVTLPLVDNEECHKAYNLVLGMSVYFPKGISKELLCAGYKDGGKDACQGDSGGPLMVLNEKTNRWILAGIVSVGRSCAEPGFPGLYTRMTNYVSWIKNVTKT